MRAAKTPLERLRRRAWEAFGSYGPGYETYLVGQLVWCWFGSNGLQLARVKMPNPVHFDGKEDAWWWVDVFWPTRGRWVQTHRQVLRGLRPPEVHALRESGVVEGGPS